MKMEYVKYCHDNRYPFQVPLSRADDVASLSESTSISGKYWKAGTVVTA
jgi:hypothetical protein